MKKYLLRLLLVSVIAVFMAVFILKTDARSTETDDKLKGDNRAGCVEVIEAKNGAPSCTTANSISIHLKVNCDKPVDIQMTYKGIHNGKTVWLAKTFMSDYSAPCMSAASMVSRPRDCSPSLNMFIAALWSRSMTKPQHLQ
jgi:hypothetical protein